MRYLIFHSILAVLLTSCFHSMIYGVGPSPQDPSGTYEFVYSGYLLGKEYIKNLDELESIARMLPHEKVNKMYDQAFDIAVPLCLAEHNLIPTECINGIVILSHHRVEGGKGYTRFRCK